MNNYLKDSFFPFWLNNGLDELGGFQEKLNSDLSPFRDENKKRVLVQFRQIFVFSKAFEITGNEDYLNRAVEAFEFAVSKYWDQDNGGFFHALDLDLNISHSNKNLYDHAFALFSFAHLYKVTESEDIISWIEESHDYIQEHFKTQIGYHEYLNADNSPKDSAREQNPHMHLLEGYLALVEILQDETCLECARDIVDLAANKMVDKEYGGLVEFFTDDWESFDKDKGHIIEPGHCFEWAWLFLEYERLTADDTYTDYAKAVYEFGYEYGTDKEFGGIFNQVTREGKPLDENKRIWPETEAIKAHLAMYALTGEDEYQKRAHAQYDFLFQNRLNENGSWKEHLKRNLDDATEVFPGTTPYHLLMAFLELGKHS